VRQVPQQLAADAAALGGGGDVRVADEVDVADGLDAHDAEQLAAGLSTPEGDPGGDLVLKLAPRHVGLVPAVRGDHSAVGLGRRVDDGEDGGALVVAARPDAAHDGAIYG
jgi:hypothetical protein